MAKGSHMVSISLSKTKREGKKQDFEKLQK